ncbi:MAG: hypothetical protein Q4F95_14500 [Oscillospiraceae bacterium]|nr:hypothetical protein [Oscillospiraceae bacterium]
MSGISTGSIFYKPAMMILSAANASEKLLKASAASVFAGSQAVRRYNLSQSATDEILTDRLAQKYICELKNDITVQSSGFEKSLDASYKAISEAHESIARSSRELMSQGLKDFRDMLSVSAAGLNERVDNINTAFQKKYIDVINSSDARLTVSMNNLKMSVAEYAEDLEHTAHQKSEYEKQQALSVLEDAQKLIDCAVKKNRLDVRIQQAQLEQAKSDLGQGNYQSSMSLSSTVITQLYMKMLRSDADNKQKNFYRQNGVFLAGEIKEFLDQLKETQFRSDAESDEVSVIDLTQFMKKDYEEYLLKLDIYEKSILSESSDIISIKNAVFALNDLYTKITASVAEAFALMIYSLKRVETEKKIHSILKEKGFLLVKTCYTDGDPVKAGERHYVCSLTDEELTLSVVPCIDEDYEVRTNLIMASDSPDCSEESRKQYRDEILELLKKDDSVESAEMSCSESTRNVNASDTQQYNIKIKNPVEYRQ